MNKWKRLFQLLYHISGKNWIKLGIGVTVAGSIGLLLLLFTVGILVPGIVTVTALFGLGSFLNHRKRKNENIHVEAIDEETGNRIEAEIIPPNPE